MVATIIGWVLVVVFGVDLIVFFVKSLSDLPTGFTEWVCYPFYPLVADGFSMFVGIIIRIIEIVGIIVGTNLITH